MFLRNVLHGRRQDGARHSSYSAPRGPRRRSLQHAPTTLNVPGGPPGLSVRREQTRCRHHPWYRYTLSRARAPASCRTIAASSSSRTGRTKKPSWRLPQRRDCRRQDFRKPRRSRFPRCQAACRLGPSALARLLPLLRLPRLPPLLPLPPSLWWRTATATARREIPATPERGGPRFWPAWRVAATCLS